MTAEEAKTTDQRRLKITDYFRKANHPLPEVPSHLTASSSLASTSFTFTAAAAIKRSSEMKPDETNLGDQSLPTLQEKKTKTDTPPEIDLDTIMAESGEGNTNKNTSSSSRISWSFFKLAEVLTDDNLVENPSQVEDTYVLYQQPWVKGQVPLPLQPEDDFSNATNYIKMPFQNNLMLDYNGERLNKWALIKKLLGGKISSIYQLEKAIKAYNPMVRYLEFDILRSYIHYQLDEDDKEYFFDELLPAIIELALDLPNLVTVNLPILDQDTSTALFLSQRQISSLLANAFLCTYSQRFKDDRRCINFARLYSSKGSERRKSCKLEKIKCLLNYLRRVINSAPVGTVSFERKRLAASAAAPESSSKKLCKFDINSGQCMFKHGAAFTMVDFANKFIGGGVLNSGCVQEEIFAVLCPELIVGKLITERLGDTDALLITGIEQFSEYSGYSDAFKWNGNHRDDDDDCGGLGRDRYGRRLRQIVAMDALRFAGRPAIEGQYEKEKIDRELFKAMTAFQRERFLLDRHRLPAISTGNWGCGAYNGDPYLKTLIQLVAASETGRDLHYFAFNEEQLKADFEEIRRLLASQAEMTVAELYNLTLEYGERRRREPKLDLLSFLSMMLETIPF